MSTVTIEKSTSRSSSEEGLNEFLELAALAERLGRLIRMNGAKERSD